MAGRDREYEGRDRRTGCGRHSSPGFRKIGAVRRTPVRRLPSTIRGDGPRSAPSFGPVRSLGTVVLKPNGNGSKTRVSIEFDLVGHGFGKLIAPLARMQARKSIVDSREQLKAKLEAGAGGDLVRNQSRVSAETRSARRLLPLQEWLPLRD